MSYQLFFEGPVHYDGQNLNCQPDGMDSPENIPTGDDNYAIGLEFRCVPQSSTIWQNINFWVYGSPQQNSANGMILQKEVIIENFVLKWQYTFYHFWYGNDISWTIKMAGVEAADDTVCDGEWHHVGASLNTDGRRSIWFDYTELNHDYPTGSHADLNDNFCLGGEDNAGRAEFVFFGDIQKFEVLA